MSPSTVRFLATFVHQVRILVFRALLGRDPPDKNRAALVDMSVYDANSKLRLSGSTKRGQERYLEPYRGQVQVRKIDSFFDTLVTAQRPQYVLGPVGEARFTLCFRIPETENARVFVHEMQKDYQLKWLRNEGDCVFMYRPEEPIEVPSKFEEKNAPQGWHLVDGPLPALMIREKRAEEKPKEVCPPIPYCNPLMETFLEPFHVPQGALHNVRWTTLGSICFLIPPKALEQLPAVMAACTQERLPFFLNEAPGSTHIQGQMQKLLVDADGLPPDVGPDQVATAVGRILELPSLVECDVLEAPPRPDQPDRRFVHFVFQCLVETARVGSALKLLKEKCPPEWNIDAGITSSRTLGSDKMDREKREAAGRTLQYVGCWVEGVAVEHLHLTLEDRYRRCSLLAGLQGLPTMIPPPPSSSSSNSLPLTSLTLDEAQMALVKVELAHGFQKAEADVRPALSSIKRFENYFVVSTNIRDCPYCGRKHASYTQKALFYKTHWAQESWRKECDMHEPVRHRYVNPQAMKELYESIFPAVLDAAEAGGGGLTFDAAKKQVIACFPQDKDLWEECKELWQEGPYFGPQHMESYTVDYRLGFGTLLRRAKAGPKKPLSCEVKRFDLDPKDSPGVLFDQEKRIEMLDACEAT